MQIYGKNRKTHLFLIEKIDKKKKTASTSEEESITINTEIARCSCMDTYVSWNSCIHGFSYIGGAICFTFIGGKVIEKMETFQRIKKKGPACQAAGLFYEKFGYQPGFWVRLGFKISSSCGRGLRNLLSFADHALFGSFSSLAVYGRRYSFPSYVTNGRPFSPPKVPS